MSYLDETDAEIDGVTVQAWVEWSTGMALSDYKGLMAKAKGPESWGGFLEVSLLNHALGDAQLKAFMFEEGEDGWHLVSCCGSHGAPAAFMGWTGGHWVVLELDASAKAKLEKM